MKIVLATGGSAGHLFPAIEVANELKKGYHEVTFVGSLNIGKDVLDQKGYPCELVKAKGLQGKSIFDDIWAGLSLGAASLYCVAKLCKIKPDVVVGFGGYAAFPVIVAALILRKPTMIHEQNVVPGRANKLLGRYVKKIAISFDQSKKYFDSIKTVVTGCPIKNDRLDIHRSAVLKEFGFKDDVPVILVFGGSQGSKSINNVCLRMVGVLKEKIDFQIIHICGKGNIAGLEEYYCQLGIPNVVVEFFQPMQKAYCAASIVISRAGASTISEIALFERPAILIPYPYAGSHQLENAKVLSDLKVATIVEEKDLNIDDLVEHIVNLNKRLTDDKIYDDVGKALKFAEASKKLADEVASLK